MKLIDRIKPPCPKCPYTLGKVQFVENPCPSCKLNDYAMYYSLIGDDSREHKIKKQG